jgi:hypothetical protein
LGWLSSSWRRVETIFLSFFLGFIVMTGCC